MSAACTEKPLYSEFLQALVPTRLELWRPSPIIQKPSRRALKMATAGAFGLAKAPVERPTLADGRASSREAARDSRGDREADERRQFALEARALEMWQEREANPDDYEPETTLCEECAEPVWFDVTTSGTLTTSCQRCGWIDAGSIYQQRGQPVRGAFGVPRVLKTKRRFWSVAEAVIRVARRTPKPPKAYQRKEGPRAAPKRIFVVADLTPFVLKEANPNYAKRASVFQSICAFAAEHQHPFIVPVPEGITAKEWRGKLASALQQSRKTYMGRWSVCQIKEGVRVGLIGSWREPGRPIALGEEEAQKTSAERTENAQRSA